MKKKKIPDELLEPKNENTLIGYTAGMCTTTCCNLIKSNKKEKEMIKNLETYGWKAAIRGMRNPMMSHNKSDSEIFETSLMDRNADKKIGLIPNQIVGWDLLGPAEPAGKYKSQKNLLLGPNDLKLCKKLIKAGPSHRKFLRQIQISCDIKANLKWWDQFSTYIFTVCNSSSQMHKLGSKLLTKEDFSSIDDRILDIVNEKITKYQQTKSKEDWRDMIDSIPQSFLYLRTVTMNYEVFLSIYANRKGHKMEEWRIFCGELRKDLPYMEIFLKELEKNRRN